MNGCQTCGGFGMHHDLGAHFDLGEDVRVTYAEAADPGPHRYENHQWTNNDPDWCARCGVDWDDADIACEEIR